MEAHSDTGMDMAEEDIFPAITRALGILRERYQDQILLKKQCQQNEQNDEWIEEDSIVLFPQPLTVTPLRQEIRPSLFTGLSQKAQDKYLQRKQSFSSQDKVSHPKFLMKVNALGRVLRRCQEWSLKFHSLEIWKDFCYNRKVFQQKFLSRLNHRFESEIFSLKFSRQVCQVCIQRYGKGRLSQRYEEWRISRFYFYCWLQFIC